MRPARRRRIRGSSSPTCGGRMSECRDGSRRGTARPRASNARSPGRRMANESRSFPITTRPGQFQVYLAAAEGGEVRRLTTVTGLLADPRWSPDGARLGVLFTRDASRAAGPFQPGEALTGVIDEKVVEQRLSTIDLHSGEVREVSPPDMYVYEFDWSPDGTRCVAIAAHGSGDNHWYIAAALRPRDGDGEDDVHPRPQDAGRRAPLVAGRPDASPSSAGS